MLSTGVLPPVPCGGVAVYSDIVKPQNGDGHQGSELREEDSGLSHEAAQDQEAGKRGGSAKSIKQG